MDDELRAQRERRAATIARSGSLEKALREGLLQLWADVSVSEALILGFLRQGVRKYLGVFGHGSTEIGEVLRIYQNAGLVEVYNLRSEIEASHAAAALKKTYDETAVVFTSIGPGALQALCASLVGQSDGLGIYYVFGDETTHDEGYNMQQIPSPGQDQFLKLMSVMGAAYSLHTGPALPAALKRGIATVFNPFGARPFYFLLPMNVQASMLVSFNIEELPRVPEISTSFVPDSEAIGAAVDLIVAAEKVVVKVGNGASGLADSNGRFGLLAEFLDRADAAYVHGPQAVGLLPGSNRRNMTVGGSKGSMGGNFAMGEADLAIVIGARAVCQWDSSGTAWAKVRNIISINTSVEDALHYNRTLPLIGDSAEIVQQILVEMRKRGVEKGKLPTPWYLSCKEKKDEWETLLATRTTQPPLLDAKFGSKALTQPAAIAEVLDFCREVGAVKYFDAGDVQANGFQMVEDDEPGLTFTETGASYMGFAVSALLASALAKGGRYSVAFSGDGSFMMNPQILIDAIAHGVHGTIVLFDNRRMSAISNLQIDQYGVAFGTDDGVSVDYAAMASAVEGVKGIRGGQTREELGKALRSAYEYPKLSVVHVPVYFGADPAGGLGAYGSWNVGNWCEAVQSAKHRIAL